jgi:LacI family transcriptional regulator
MTIKEIAKIANVSIGTVDRVLHKRGRVSPVTQKRILKIIEESGFKANPFASRLATSLKKYKFAVVIPFFEQDSYYWSLLKSGIDRAVLSLSKYNLQVEYFCFDRYSGDDFEKVYTEAFSQNFDAYLIAPVISGRAVKCIKDYPLQVPYAFFDTTLSSVTPLFYISQNSLQGGKLAGKIMHLLIGEAGDLAVTRMLPEGEHITERIEGFKNYFSEFPGIRIHEFQIEYAKGGRGVGCVCNEITSHSPAIKGIFVPTANAHLFAETLTELNLTADIKLVGFDLVPDNIQCLRDKTVDFIISQSPELQGEKSVNLLFEAIAFNDTVPLCNTVPLGIYTEENLEEYAIGTG